MALLCGSETCTIQVKDKPRITAPSMQFLKQTEKYTQKYYKRNQVIVDELKTKLIFISTLDYR